MQLKFLFTILFIGTVFAVPQVPTIPAKYYVKFYFGVPQWKDSGLKAVREPVEAWMDETTGLERLTFWDGVDDNIIHKLNSNTFEKWSIYPKYETTVCDRVKSNYGVAINLASAFPADLSKFIYSGLETVAGQSAQKWTRYLPENGATNNYTFYVTNDNKQTPIQYVYQGMSGTVLGYDHSPNYDWFQIDYSDFKPGYFNKSAFLLPKLCQNVQTKFQNLQTEEHLAPTGLEKSFKELSEKHSWNYENTDEKNIRKNIFRQNAAKIFEHNKRYEQGLTAYNMALNHLADRTEKELTSSCYKQPTELSEEFYSADLSVEVPQEVNWRTTNKVSVLKDQGDCGSCWSFGSTGAVESAVAIKFNTSADLLLSEQFLLDCSWAEGNMACNGGAQPNAYQYVINQGGEWPLESDYTYKMNEAKCNLNVAKSNKFKLSSYKNVVGEQNMLSAIANEGPVTIAISTMPAASWSFYHSGVYDNTGCKPSVPDHAVLVTGYGYDSKSGLNYWTIKNSWSKYWGMEGYINIARKGDICGVTQFGALPVVV